MWIAEVVLLTWDKEVTGIHNLDDKNEEKCLLFKTSLKIGHSHKLSVANSKWVFYIGMRI